MNMFWRVICCFMLLPIFSFAKTAEHSFYDENQVRYQLVQTNGKQPYNWLFLPGGPGSDSTYLQGLIDLLDLPGNVWLIDLPGCGKNVQENQDYNQWFKVFSPIFERFSNPILVGHSFGGMFPLLFPELEQQLKGLILLHTAPCLYQEESLRYAKKFSLPSVDRAIQAFAQEPNQQTFDVAIDACIPYYFPPSSRAEGKKLFELAAFQYQPAVWWLAKMKEINFSALWIPKSVPTLIVGGKYDCVTPFSLFKKDRRFKRDNVKLLYLKKGGHFSWIDDPKAIQKAFGQFIKRLSKVSRESQEERSKKL